MSEARKPEFESPRLVQGQRRGSHFGLRAVARSVTTKRGLATGRWLSAAGIFLSIGLGTLLGALAGSTNALPSEVAMVLFVGAIVAGMYAAQGCLDLFRWLGQQGRDVVAARIWSAVRAGQRPPQTFTLYLRPFASTDAISADVERLLRIRPLAGGPTTIALASDRVEFEAEMERGLRGIGPLVALGKPLEHMGAGRIEVADDEWQEAVELLMDAARLIILLPSSRRGTIWEVRALLLAGRLEKTIVVDPPDDLGDPHPDYDPSTEWAHVRQSFATFGYELPADEPKGLLYYFGDTLSPVLSARIKFDGASSVRTFAGDVLRLADAQPDDSANEMYHARTIQ